MLYPRLTLSMIVKNEAANLERCLDSVSKIVDEIVIVDTGSSDHTKLIAYKYNAKVFDFTWIDDFSAARNFALERSSGEYILYLDADEYLSPNSINEISSIVNSGLKAGFLCRVINPIRGGNTIEMLYPRLFSKHPEILFEGKVHEQIELSLRKMNFEIFRTDIVIFHTGYEKEKSILEDKARRNLNILLDEININPSAYNHYQAGNTYSILGDTKNAMASYNKSLLMNGLAEEYKIIAGLYIAENALKSGEKAIAKKHLEMVINCRELKIADLLTIAEIAIKLDDHLIANEILDKACVEFYSSNQTERAINRIITREEFLIKYLVLKVKLTNSINIHNLFDLLEEKVKDQIIIKDMKNLLLYPDLNTLGIFINNRKNEIIEDICYLVSKYFPDNLLISAFNLISSMCLDLYIPKYYLAETYSKNSNHTEALKIYLKILEDGVETPSLYFFICSEYLSLGEKNNALHYISVLEKRYNENPVVKTKIDRIKSSITR